MWPDPDGPVYGSLRLESKSSSPTNRMKQVKFDQDWQTSLGVIVYEIVKDDRHLLLLFVLLKTKKKKRKKKKRFWSI